MNSRYVKLRQYPLRSGNLKVPQFHESHEGLKQWKKINIYQTHSLEKDGKYWVTTKSARFSVSNKNINRNGAVEAENHLFDVSEV